MLSPSPTIRSAGPGDLAAALRLLQNAGLPSTDLSSALALDFWVLETEGSRIGAAGLERFGKYGLLRSLVIAPDHRRGGLGRRLVVRVEREARGSGVEMLALLTETAEQYFKGLGYASVPRRDVPEQIKDCAQFRSLCPASAVCMTKSLENPYKE